MVALAQFPQQPLRDNGRHGAPDLKSRHAEVDQPRNGRYAVVRVQRRKHQMARLRRLDRDLRRFQVANLADHHHVRVLPQHRPQRTRERQSGFRVDLHLVQPRERVFHGIFHRDDIDRRPLDRPHAGIERRAFARSRGSGDQQHPLRHAQDFVQPSTISGGIPSEPKSFVGDSLSSSRNTTFSPY